MQVGVTQISVWPVLLLVLVGMFAVPAAVRGQSAPAYTVRMAVKPPPPPSELVLVRFDTNDAGCADFKAFRAEDGAGAILPCRVAWTTSNAVFVLVYTEGMANRASEIYLYGTDPAKAQTDHPIWTNDLMRVGVTVRQRNSPTLPNTWDRFLYFWERSTSGSSAGVEADLDIDDFAAMMVRLGEHRPAPRTGHGRHDVDIGKKTAWREAYGRPAILVRLESQALFPSDGDYRLALSCRDSGYLLVDGELALAVESGATPTAWQIGDARRYSAGLHTLEVMTGSLDPVIRVGWSPPGTSEIAPLGADTLLAPGPVVEGRFEVRGRFVHANFSHTILEPYRFRDMPGVFTPVRFTDTSRNPGGGMLTRRWLIDGRSIEGATAVHTFAESGQHPVRLILSDNLAATDACERVVDVRTRVVREYAVDFEVGGLPPACFADDQFSPYLVAWGKGPAGVGFRVAWSFLDAHTNVVSGGETNVTLVGPAVKVDLGKQDAGCLRSLQWGVSVAGKTIRSGNIRFDRAPFAAWPESVVADRLCDRTGARTVLVTSLGWDDDAYGEPENAPPAVGPVVLLDDTLVPYAVPGAVRETYAVILPRLLEGMREVRYASLAPGDESSASLKSLAKFVALPKLAGDGADRTVVLSTGIHDLLLGGDAESFERGLAVMVDKLLADKAAVVLVTPPPYPGMEARMRPLAVAVRRVGDAHGLAVADLYTAFMGMRQDGGPFFELDTFGLTARGHRLAADRIARALAKSKREQ
jgi:hypothetical protein